MHKGSALGEPRGQAPADKNDGLEDDDGFVPVLFTSIPRINNFRGPVVPYCKITVSLCIPEFSDDISDHDHHRSPSPYL